MLKVLIADDHDFIREGFKLILQEEYPRAHFGEAQDTASLISKACGFEWDIILSDISMPGGGGIHAIEQIMQQKQERQVRILVVSMFPGKQYAQRAHKAGALGYVNKETVTEHLVPAVRAILSGSPYFPVFDEQG